MTERLLISVMANTLGIFIVLLFILRQLERIADHLTKEE